MTLKYDWLYPFNLEGCKDTWKKEEDKWCISVWREKYTLCRDTHKGKRKSIRLAISRGTATQLIRELKLNEYPSGIFKHAFTYSSRPTLT